MPRDANGTRQRLLTEAERLFAEVGVHHTTTKQIVTAADQRNTSALTYHFGSREGLLREILRRHNVVLDELRGRLLDDVGEAASTRALVGVLLLAHATGLADQSGRDFMRIVAQLSEVFPRWGADDDIEGTNLQRVLNVLASRHPDLSPAIRQSRIVAMITLMTASMADRATRVERGRRPALDDATWLANLADMLVALLEAGSGGLLTTRDD